MPIFDFKCLKCGYMKEILMLKESETANPVCLPSCGEKLTKMVPAPGLLVTNFQNKPAPKMRRSE